MKLDKSQIGITGEYYVLAQLSARGFLATLTLGNTKGVDILVTNREINRLFKIEVKTTLDKAKVNKLFSDKFCYHWTMSKKHESIIDDNLIYCFVLIEGIDRLPLFFLVPSKKVAEYVKWQHQYWLDQRGGKDTAVRKFRIEKDDPAGYRDNWSLLA